MFENIGGKIKALAKVVTWIGIIGSVLAGIIMISAGSRGSGGTLMVLPGLLMMVIGSLSAWIASFVLYGFGQLIENSDKIASRS